MKLENERMIALITGDSGSGKSFFMANLKDAIIYDTDLGGGLAYADKRIAKNGSERVQLSSYVDLLNDLKKRAGNGSLKTTISIDHLTALHQESYLRHSPTDGKSDFGRAANKATNEWRRVREFCRKLDCNLFVTAHMKGEWENDQQIGKTTDGAKNIEADVSVVLYLMHQKGTGYPSTARVIKWRRDPEDERGLVPVNFQFTTEKFIEICGQQVMKPREDVKLASAEQIENLKKLMTVTKLPDSPQGKWLAEASAEDIAELTEDKIQKAIDYLKGLVFLAEGKEKKAKEAKG